MNFNKKNYSNKLLVELYKQLLRSRLIEQKMLILLRQGKISKWFSGIGQEAVSIGAAMALESNEFILPAHRNLGIFTSRNVPLNRLFAQFFGKKEGFTKGRDRSFHFGSKEHHIVGMISHLGPQLTVANGISLAEKLSEDKKVVLAITGEGGSSEGDFHEALKCGCSVAITCDFFIRKQRIQYFYAYRRTISALVASLKKDLLTALKLIK